MTSSAAALSVSVDYNSREPHTQRSVGEKIARSLSWPGIFTLSLFLVPMLVLCGVLWIRHSNSMTAAQHRAPSASQVSMVSADGS